MPAFLISQKSKIFDSFPPGEAYVKLKFDAIKAAISKEIAAFIVSFIPFLLGYLYLPTPGWLQQRLLRQRLPY